MPARVEIDELNTVGVTTHGVVNLNVGDIDAPNIVVGALTSIKRKQNAYVKYHRLHFIDLGDASTVGNIRVWMSAGDLLPGETIQTNLGEWDSYSYVAAFSTPTKSPNYAANNISVTYPLTPNLGIGGNLRGVITPTLGANKLSDIWKWHLQVSVETPTGALRTKQFSFSWEET